MTLNYQQGGQGQPVILLHGLFGSLENLNGIKRALETDYRVVNLDLPDHGRSPASSHFSYARYAQQVLETLDGLQLDQVALLGHSMGGKVAMQLALDHPDRVVKLLVADIAPVPYPKRHGEVFAGLNNVNLAALDGRQSADRQLAEHIHEPGVRQFLLKSLQKDEERWQWRFNLPLLQAEYDKITGWPDSDRQFKGPTLFIKGGNSDYITAQQRDAIVRQFPNSQGHIIADAGHWLHAEKPAAFNKIARDFIAADGTG
ncbi:alpha/beta fold hydrolase [Bowmanella dokdonensis]|uniref:Alpha/beta fold hydrolase n=1 Tax=Bowmanella dokdonensis TaxID=751969 RepID=A0A939DL67_9ALTE|nr:alpha/beta fold hydrolase [Bowmanella dokdonensis]MBN7824600.1 alpha/beta fold hydrolase [Bowmanella dokdonensis]